MSAAGSQHRTEPNTVCASPYGVVDSRARSSSKSTALLCSLIFLVAENFAKGSAGRRMPLASNLHATMNLLVGSSLRLGLHSGDERTASGGAVSADQLPIAGTSSNTREIQIRENPQRLAIDRELG